MKIISTLRSYDNNTRHSYHLEIEAPLDLGPSLGFYDGEPEDNTLMRNFNDVFHIIDLMQAAYEVGKSGEPFETIDRSFEGFEEE
jgi:hypothetical protein